MDPPRPTLLLSVQPVDIDGALTVELKWQNARTAAIGINFSLMGGHLQSAMSGSSVEMTTENPIQPEVYNNYSVLTTLYIIILYRYNL